MRLRSILTVAALASASLIAQASTIVFNVDNLDFNNSGSESITGTLTFNTATDTFTSANLTAKGFSSILGENEDSLIDATLTSSNSSQGTKNSLEYLDINLSDGDSLDLFLPVSTLSADGGNICASNNGTDCLYGDTTSYSAEFQFIGTDTQTYNALTGSLAPQTDPDPAPTPEPSTLLLLGTGLLGIAGVMRRRLA